MAYSGSGKGASDVRKGTTMNRSGSTMVWPWAVRFGARVRAYLNTRAEWGGVRAWERRRVLLRGDRGGEL